MADDEPFTRLLEAMRRAAAVLRDASIDFALAGGIAIYARGGPATEHDVDFLLRAEDAERALHLLAEDGFRTERPPEGWLYKAFDGDEMVDLIFAPNGKPDVVDNLLNRAEPLEVFAITVKVMTVTDVLESKLLTLKEHELSYDGLLEIARACREQIEWERLRERTATNPYTKAFFTLVDELDLATPP